MIYSEANFNSLRLLCYSSKLCLAFHVFARSATHADSPSVGVLQCYFGYWGFRWCWWLRCMVASSVCHCQGSWIRYRRQFGGCNKITLNHRVLVRRCHDFCTGRWSCDAAESEVGCLFQCVNLRHAVWLSAVLNEHIIKSIL
jgi:hypothetical protein